MSSPIQKRQRNERKMLDTATDSSERDDLALVMDLDRLEDDWETISSSLSEDAVNDASTDPDLDAIEVDEANILIGLISLNELANGSHDVPQQRTDDDDLDITRYF